MNMLAVKLRKIAADLVEVAAALAESDVPLQIGKARYFRAKGTMQHGKCETTLTRSQATVLNALIDSRGVCVSRPELMSLIFGPDAAVLDSRSVDNHVCILRAIVGRDAIATVSGRGYRLCL